MLFGTLSTIIGTLIGFLAGIYVPPAAFSTRFAKIMISLFPVSYSASMLRRVFTADPLKKVFSNADQVVT